MAGDYLPVRLDLRDDPAVIAMAAELSVEQDLIVGKLIRLWSWANRQTADGYVKGVSAQWIDGHVGCAGFASAMARVDWLEVTDDGATFPKWDRWNDETAKKRLQGVARKRRQRAREDSVTQMSRSPRDKSVTTVQKQKQKQDSGCDQRFRAFKDSAINVPTQEITAEHVADANKVARVVKPRKFNDFVLIARAVLLKRDIGENALWDAVEAVKHTANTIPAAYFHTSLRNNAPRFDELAKSIVVNNAAMLALFPETAPPNQPDHAVPQSAPLFN